MSENTDLILDDFEAPQSFRPEYAGFWIRVAAYLIDSIVIQVATSILMFIFMGSLFLNPESMENPDQVLGRVLPLYVILIVGSWLYYALMESSAQQGTLGKMAVGIKVTDMDGARISFGNATGRFFGKMISGLILGVGYLMVAFTDKKQGLHDMMAGTLVVQKR
ncbi:MAG TPA: RDD family protein [Saprospiraceae bacterium]|nr:RDD family protein [Saprospiraceae bacterium]